MKELIEVEVDIESGVGSRLLAAIDNENGDATKVLDEALKARECSRSGGVLYLVLDPRWKEEVAARRVVDPRIGEDGLNEELWVLFSPAGQVSLMRGRSVQVLEVLEESTPNAPGPHLTDVEIVDYTPHEDPEQAGGMASISIQMEDGRPTQAGPSLRQSNERLRRCAWHPEQGAVGWALAAGHYGMTRRILLGACADCLDELRELAS